MLENLPDTPTIVDILLKLTDELSSVEYRSYDCKYSNKHKHMPHTIVTHIFNMISVLASNTKDPNPIRTLKCKGTIDAKLYNILAYVSK